MNVCLIRPPSLMKLFSFIMKPTPPLGLALIAGALHKAGHKVSVIDAIAEKPDQLSPFYKDLYTNGLTYNEILNLIPPETEVIGLNIMFTCNWLSDRKLINYLGEQLPNVTIIAGGEHITAIPELCIKQTNHLKVCVTGEGEETVVELINSIEKNTSLHQIPGIVFKKENEVIKNTNRNRIRNIEEIAWPAWEFFPLSEYKKHGFIYGVDRGVNALPIMATRGCPYSCTFCSSPQMWTTKYYMRSPKDVVNEMEFFYNKFQTSNFDFYDLTAIIKREWIIEFAKEIISRNLKITWQIPAGTRSEAIDKEVAHHLYLSGCTNITYAPESGSERILKSIKKKVVLDNMIKSIKYSYEENMSIKINIIVGFPEEKHTDIWKTILFLIKASWNGVHDIAPGLFSAYPGTELYNKLSKEGEININSDEYFLDTLYAESFLNNRIYNKNMHRYFIRTYLILYIVFFYSTNYLFRPWRLYNMIKNIVNKRFETRGEMGIYEIFKRKNYKLLKTDEYIYTPKEL